MTITIRPADPSVDYEAVAVLLTATQPEPVTADQLREADQMAFEGSLRRRSVAANADGVIVGYSLVARDDWSERFSFNVLVDPAHRRQGIGALMYDEALADVQARGAKMLRAQVRENEAEALRFAEKRGFKVVHHLFESTIDLKQFDQTLYDALLREVAAGGIRIFSLADAGNTDEMFAQLYAVNRDTAFDIPGSDKTFPTLEEFNKIVRHSTWFVPEGQLLAADGDRVIGLSAVGYFKETNSTYNMMTGVLPEYRGRKIAYALKVHALCFAKQYGADYSRTHNESTNVGILAINRKLGYQPEPGIFVLEMPLVGVAG